MKDVELAGRHRSFYDSADAQRFGRTEMVEEGQTTAEWLRRTGVEGADRPVVELGAGFGALSGLHRRYVGLEFSLHALSRFVPGSGRLNADMQRLPFQSSSVGAFFSWAALEHVPNPEMVLAEIERTLAPGGVAILCPAWNCRPWAAKALPIRRYAELNWRERIAKLTIPLRNNIFWLAAQAFPRRVWREAAYAVGGRPSEFDYRRLEPNLDEYVYTDCDAFTAMDSHSAILYFASRRWDVITHRGFLRRMLSRNEVVVVRKPVVETHEE